MPSVNLRLTDEEHAELVEAAKRENRSLQREMIYRMFNQSAGPPKPARPEGPAAADSQSRDVQARTIAVAPLSEGEGTIPARSGEAVGSSTPRRSPSESGFRGPDPKPERKKK